MTPDEILRMALETDALGEHGTFYTLAQKRPEVFVRFAAMVAAAEREECAKVCEYRAMALDYSGNQYVRDHAALDCARSIRARENKS